MPTCAWRLAAHCCTARGAVPLWWQAMHAWLSLDVPLASLEMSGVVGAPPCAKAEATARGTPHSKTMNGRARGSYFIYGAPFPLPLFVGLRVAGRSQLRTSPDSIAELIREATSSSSRRMIATKGRLEPL